MISSWSHDVVSSERWQPVKRFMTRTETHTIRCKVLVSSSVAERIYIFEASSNHKTWCAPFVALRSKSGGLKWFLFCVRERGRNDCRRIQIKCDVCISHWVSTGVMWTFLSMMGFVSRRPTAFIKLLDIQIYRWNHFLQTDAHWWHLQALWAPRKKLFWISFSFEKCCERSRNTLFPKYCFEFRLLGLYYRNFQS